MSEKELIQKCLKNDRNAQNFLYEKHCTPMFGVCRRYMKDDAEAESCMISGFIKVFKNLNQYKHNGSFEGWIRKIMVNECLMELRKRRNFNISIETVSHKLIEEFTIDQELHQKDIIQLLDYLPAGYRTVFNLFVIEQYSHEEIADKLGISINTSKSQLVKARTRLKQYIQQLNIAI